MVWSRSGDTAPHGSKADGGGRQRGGVGGASVIVAVVVKMVVGERSIDRVVHLYPAVHNRQIGRHKLWGSFQQE